MTSNINGIIVPDELMGAANSVKRKGGRVYLIRPEAYEPLLVDAADSKQLCDNCNGIGHLGLSVIVGGPFDAVPPSGGGDDSPKATHIDGKWYLQRTNRNKYTCPICNGSGGYVQRQAKPQSINL